MKIAQILDMVDYNIVQSDKYMWKCYGDNARIFDIGTKDKECGSFIVDRYNLVVELTFEKEIDGKIQYFRWISPDYLEAYKAECLKYSTPFEAATEESNYIEVPIKALCEELTQIFNRKTENIDIDISDKDFLYIARAAHLENMTIQDFIETAIIDQVIYRQDKKTKLK